MKQWYWYLGVFCLLCLLVIMFLWGLSCAVKVKAGQILPVTTTETLTIIQPPVTLPPVTLPPITLPPVPLPPVVKNHYIEVPGPTITVTTPVAVVTYIDVPGPTTTLPPVTTTLPATTTTIIVTTTKPRNCK